MDKMTEDKCRIGYTKSQAWILKVLQGSSHYILRMTDPDRGFSSMSEGKKNKNEISWPAGVGGKKTKKGKIDIFSVKMTIFRGKNDRSSKVNPACRRKKKLRWLLFFLVGHKSST